MHFHLKQAMMLGKRKTTDVQFMENVIHEDEAGSSLAMDATSSILVF